MTARTEIEDILAEALWRDRNGLDPSIVVTPKSALSQPACPNHQLAAYASGLEMLREHETQTYRDCPRQYANTPSKLVHNAWGFFLLAVATLVAGGGLGMVWNLIFHHHV